jgi:hypothetical protein
MQNKKLHFVFIAFILMLMTSCITRDEIRVKQVYVEKDIPNTPVSLKVPQKWKLNKITILEGMANVKLIYGGAVVSQYRGSGLHQSGYYPLSHIDFTIYKGNLDSLSNTLLQKYDNISLKTILTTNNNSPCAPQIDRIYIFPISKDVFFITTMRITTNNKNIINYSNSVFTDIYKSIKIN